MPLVTLFLCFPGLGLGPRALCTRKSSVLPIHRLLQNFQRLQLHLGYGLPEVLCEVVSARLSRKAEKFMTVKEACGKNSHPGDASPFQSTLTCALWGRAF